jgi:hypothetical protein
MVELLNFILRCWQLVVGQGLREKAFMKLTGIFGGDFFIKRAPAQWRRGPTRKETYMAPPTSFL